MRLIFSILIFLMCTQTQFAQSLDAPQIRCVSVLANGSVEITWSQIADPNGQFSSYNLHNGAGSLLTSVTPISNTNHVHAGAGANLSSQSFYMQSIATNSANNSSVTQTVSTMFLQVNNPGNGTAWLSWNPISTPKLPGANDYYHIYKEYPIGTWSLIDSTLYGDESYVDTITVCGELINYKIVQTGVGCSSESNVAGGFFNDMIAPNITDVEYVSVDTSNGNVNINWELNGSEDTEAYIVFYFDGSGWVILDTVYGYNNVNYTHVGAGADMQSMSYGIAAYDSCTAGGSNNTSAMGQFHETMFLQHEELVCESGIRLNWNAYQFWPGGVAQYEIYGAENGGAYVSMGSTNNSTIDIVGLNVGSTYCFVIKAISTSGLSSLSNKLCHTIYAPVQPTMGYLSTVTVNGSNIQLRYMGDPAASLQAIRIQRSNYVAGPYQTIATTAVTGGITSYTDQNVQVDARNYFYRVIAIDTCGNESIISNYGKNILCEVTSDDYLHKNTITWDNYADWDGGVDEFEVYRSINGVVDPTPIALLNNAANILEDDVSHLLDADGEFCYLIKAIENTNSFGISEYSNSNLACTYMQSLIYVPNAIVTNGVNQEFKPVMSFFDFTNYELSIFTKWGDKIFTSKDINVGWKGENADGTKQDVYVYLIEYSDSRGILHSKRGTVTVVQ